MCGDPNCWDAGDYSWLASNSGWHGELHGCQTSIFFIHGRKIREQRHVPSGDWPLSQLPELLARWSTGLPNPRLAWYADTGDGDVGLWIEGEREPNEADNARLQEYRERQEREDRRVFERLKAKFAS